MAEIRSGVPAFSVLGALSPPRTVTSYTAIDIVKFLILKDKSGRTVVHSSFCSRASCTCPKRFAAGSVDSLSYGSFESHLSDALMILTQWLIPLLKTI